MRMIETARARVLKPDAIMLFLKSENIKQIGVVDFEKRFAAFVRSYNIEVDLQGIEDTKRLVRENERISRVLKFDKETNSYQAIMI